MARDVPSIAAPEWKLKDAVDRPERASQNVWDMLNTGYPLVTNVFAYMDRIGPEMFVGRYNHGKCGAVHTDVGECDKRHAYIVTITPKGAESACIYCGTTIDGCPKANLKDIPWDEPYEKPRRATESELRAMGIDPIPEHHMLYLDEVEGKATAGRFRVGRCKEGGTHEAVLFFWRYRKDARHSYCIFCGEHWNGSPPGYWDILEPSRTVPGVLEEHSRDVQKGRY